MFTFEEISAELSLSNGSLIWRHGRKHAPQYGGMAAGCLDKEGYVVFSFKRKQLRAHRVVWLLPYGKWPTRHLDHINGNKADNRIENLREATCSQNGGNRRPDKGRRFKGVRRVPSGRFVATCNAKYVGSFDSEEEAARAYDKRAAELFGEFANLNFGGHQLARQS